MHWCRCLSTYQLSIVCLYFFNVVGAQLYKNVFVRNCASEHTNNVTSLKSAGVVIFNLTHTNPNSPYNCSLRLSVSEGRRMALTFQGELSFPVEHTAMVDGDDIIYNCSGGYVALTDPISSRSLTQPRSMCGTQSTNEWTSFLTDSNEVTISVIVQNEDFNGSILFDLKYVAFLDDTKNIDVGVCHLCKYILQSTNATTVCIDEELKCDGVINCPHGYAAEEDSKGKSGKAGACSSKTQPNRPHTNKIGWLCDYSKGPTCKFRCSPYDDTIIDGFSVCDGSVDCPNGIDENADLCSKHTQINGPFSPLSMVDGIVTIVCGFILVILISICLYCCCCPPPPTYVTKGHYSSNVNINFHDGVTSTNLEGRTSHNDTRDNNEVRISSL
ncbi:uncharacterized protein LOC100369540 [Saccoglossus kowalevskii]